MVATILLLAAFEGYWLNKLYHDEYRNLKKEVDVSFRDAMYKLQRRRFEVDTNLVDHSAYTIAFNEARKRSSHPGGKDSSQKNATIVYRSSALPEATLHGIKQGMIQAVTVSAGNVYRGVPPPELIEMIMQQKAKQHDTGTFMVKIDSNVSFGPNMPELKNRMNQMGVTVTMRPSVKDTSRYRVMTDSILDAAGIKVNPSENKKKTKMGVVAQNSKATSVQAGNFNKVVFDMGSGHTGKDASPFVRFLSNNKTINDSIPIKVVVAPSGYGIR